MSTFTVEHGLTLGPFLLRNGYQQWRIAPLITCGGVKVMRERTLVSVAGPTDRLKEGDVVVVADPPSDACQNALSKIPAADYRDYGFAPGTTAFDLQMANVVANRPQTIRITDPLVDSLAGFIRALASSALITNPIRDVLVVSHANPEGRLQMRLLIGDAEEITYEDLETAVKNKTLMIDPKLLAPRPNKDGIPAPPRFFIHGCRIGSAPAYLKKLKEALGGGVLVVAPIHFHIAAQLTKPAGYVEYMGYSFMLKQKKPLGSQADAIKAFSQAGFTRIDGQPVPAKAWKELIPSKINQAGEQQIGVKVLNPVTKANENIPARYRYRRRQLFKSNSSMALKTDPKTDAGRKKAVRDELEKQLERYRATHPFPEYVRFGYASLDDFMEGWEWDFRFDSGTLNFNAVRHEYTVIQPIVDPSSNKLYLNFYPTRSQGAVLEMLDPSDKRFFASV